MLYYESKDQWITKKHKDQWNIKKHKDRWIIKKGVNRGQKQEEIIVSSGEI